MIYECQKDRESKKERKNERNGGERLSTGPLPPSTISAFPPTLLHANYILIFSPLIKVFAVSFPGGDIETNK